MNLRILRNPSTYVILVAVLALTAGGCATKKALREGLATQDTKISGVETQVEDNQKRIEETGQRLEGVKAEATDARRIGTEAGSRADKAFDLAKGKLLYTVVLSEVGGQFAFNRYELTEEAKKTLDDLATKLKAENANVYLELQGHTDSTGPEEYNLVLGQKRADAVRQYLNIAHGIPLHKMSVISFGASKPVADNHTRQGRAQNRRVEVRVLS